MIIKMIPEENENIKPIEHTNVKEFFMFGNKKDEEGTLIDFHDWSGQYRYLLGSLTYFNELIRMEMNSQQSEKSKPNIEYKPKQFPSEEIGKAKPKQDMFSAKEIDNINNKANNVNNDMIKQVDVDNPNLKILKDTDI